MADPTLTGMPIELLVHLIATYLPTEDLGALRLTSKYFETALFDAFAKEFFTKKQFMLTTPSLTALVEISKHAALSKVVKHVIIGLEHYQPNFQGPNNKEGVADQMWLLHTGHHCVMLADAFRNLSGLQTIGIRDYSAPGRFRDGAQWHSYGAPTVARETGVVLRPNSGIELNKYSSMVFSTMIQALTDANQSVPEMEVILHTHMSGLMDYAFYIPPPLKQELKPVLEGLRVLLLTLQDGDLHETAEFLQRFLIQACNITHLRLNMQWRNRQRVANFVQEICRTPGPFLPHLQRLDLGMIKSTPEAVLALIDKFAATLHTISLWRVQFYIANDACLYVDSKPKAWLSFFQKLLKLNTPQLEAISLGNLSQINAADSRASERSGRHDPGLSVKFISKPQVLGPDGRPLVDWKRECKGEKSVFLSKLIDDVSVGWPTRPLPEESASEVTDSDIDADMDDEEEYEEEDEEEDDE